MFYDSPIGQIQTLSCQTDRIKILSDVEFTSELNDSPLDPVLLAAFNRGYRRDRIKFNQQTRRYELQESV